MASVRISNELRAQIEQEVMNLFKKSIQKAEDSLADDFGKRLAREVYDREITNHSFMIKNPIDTWPEEWLDDYRPLSIKICSSKTDTTYTIQINDDAFSFQYPKCINSNYVTYSSYNAERFEPSVELFHEYDVYKHKVRKKYHERTEFLEQVKSVLNKCNTLKQFLNAWPQGENLVPADVMAKYNAPPEKRVNPAEHVTPEVSTELSATLIKKTIVNRAN